MGKERLKEFEPFWQEWYIEEKIETGNFCDIFKLKKETDTGDTTYKALRVIEIPRIQATASSENLGERRQALHGYFGELAKVVEEEIKALHVLNGKPNILPYEEYQVLERQETVGYDILLLSPMHRSFISYISGRNLEDNHDIIKMAKDICRGLSEIHRMDFLHMDLKLENIYMEEDGNCYLGEIGIENKISTFQTGSVKRGPYEYLAPEVYLNKEYSKKADIYSMGVILYILCNDGKIPKELQRRDRKAELPVPCKAKERLTEIIFKAMSYDVKGRYADADSMLEDLENLTEDDIAFPIIEKTEEVEEAAGKTAQENTDEMPESDGAEIQEKKENLLTEDNSLAAETVGLQNADRILGEEVNEEALKSEFAEKTIQKEEIENEFIGENTADMEESTVEGGFNYDVMKENWDSSSYGAANEILSGNGLDITEQIIFGNHSFGIGEENPFGEYTESVSQDDLFEPQFLDEERAFSDENNNFSDEENKFSNEPQSLDGENKFLDEDSKFSVEEDNFGDNDKNIEEKYLNEILFHTEEKQSDEMAFEEEENFDKRLMDAVRVVKEDLSLYQTKNNSLDSAPVTETNSVGTIEDTDLTSENNIFSEENNSLFNNEELNNEDVKNSDGMQENSTYYGDDNAIEKPDMPSYFAAEDTLTMEENIEPAKLEENLNPEQIMKHVEQQYYSQFATKTIGSTVNQAMQTVQEEREKEQEQRIQEIQKMQAAQQEEDLKQVPPEEEKVILRPATPKPDEGEVILKPASSYYSQTSFVIPTTSKKQEEHTAVKRQGDFWKNTPAVGTYVDDMQEPIEIPVRAMPKKKKKTGVVLAIIFILVLAAAVIKILYSNDMIDLNLKEKKSAFNVEVEEEEKETKEEAQIKTEAEVVK